MVTVPESCAGGKRVLIHLRPRDGLERQLRAQGADKRHRRGAPTRAPVQLDLDFDKRFGTERVGAYERLLLDVIDGRLNLSVRSDEQEEAWRWVEPIMDAWSHDPAAPRAYAAGTGGPRAAAVPPPAGGWGTVAQRGLRHAA
mgnify:CR=1 FL=1